MAVISAFYFLLSAFEMVGSSISAFCFPNFSFGLEGNPISAFYFLLSAFER
jgi:hypothetical protein